jgi:hypothetical protein
MPACIIALGFAMGHGKTIYDWTIPARQARPSQAGGYHLQFRHPNAKNHRSLLLISYLN